jgi:hypothetical protein
LFEESTRVPLIVSHPQSPYKGKHYTRPVELLDIFPTVMELMNIPSDRECTAKQGQHLCKKTQGKSLVPIILGDENSIDHGASSRKGSKKVNTNTRSWNAHGLDPLDPHAALMNQDFAISQSWRCIRKAQLIKEPESAYERNFFSNWFECNVDTKDHENEVSVMGYSLRTAHFRYNAWMHFERTNNIPHFDVPIFAEELYDHRETTTANFTHTELVNLAQKPQFSVIVERYRQALIHWLRTTIPFHGPFSIRAKLPSVGKGTQPRHEGN